MNLRRIAYASVPPLVIACLVFGLTVSPALSEDINAKVRSACTNCHNLNRVCKNLGVKSEAEWTTTVQRMVGKKPVLEGEDVGSAITYLTSLEPKNPEICK